MAKVAPSACIRNDFGDIGFTATGSEAEASISRKFIRLCFMLFGKVLTATFVSILPSKVPRLSYRALMAMAHGSQLPTHRA